MKVLITGASGFLGRHLTRRFLHAGHDVRAFIRYTSRAKPLEQLGVDIVRGDLKDPASLARAVEGMEIVVHAAATMSGTPQEFIAASAPGARALIAAAEKAGVSRFVHISSIAVLSMKPPPGGEPIREDSPYETDPRLLSHYTVSKLEAEKAVLEHSKQGNMAVVILRPGLLYGPGGKIFLPRTGYPFGKNLYVVIGSGRNPLPVCYVENCADAVLAAAENSDITRDIFNIVDDETITQNEYLRAVKEGVRPHMTIIHLPYILARFIGVCNALAAKLPKVPHIFRAAHMIQCRRRLTYSNAKAKDILGWRPRVSKNDALAATAAHFAQKESFSRRADIRFVGRPPADAKPLKTCLIGCGMIAQVHADILKKTPNARLVAVCDTNREAAEKLSTRYHIPHAYTRVEEMFAAERPDAVHILTPPQSHAEYAALAAEHGVNILVEKPMALDSQESLKMADAAEKSGVMLCVDHNHLYDPVMIETRKMLELHELGDIIWVESYYGFDLGHNRASRYMLPGGEKHWTFQIPGGLYQNLAPHPLSLALDVLGAPTKISAHAKYARILPHAPNDELRILMETPEASGLVTVSLAAAPRQHYLHIFGTEKTVFADLLNKWIIVHGAAKGLPKPIARAMMNVRHGCTVLKGTLSGMAKVITRRWTPYDGVNILVREFYRSLQTGEDPPVTPREAIAVMNIMDETWRQIGPLDVPRT